MSGFELNSCYACGIQLAPDDFDGVCAECDSKDEQEQAMTETPEQIERRLAEIDQCEANGIRCSSEIEWLCATIRRLLPALAVARAAVALEETENAYTVATTKSLRTYKALLARFADAEGGSK